MQSRDGIFKGRFCYLNITEEGEVIGSDQENKDISLLIDRGNVSKLHASIKFINDSKFELKDL